MARYIQVPLAIPLPSHAFIVIADHGPFRDKRSRPNAATRLLEAVNNQCVRLAWATRPAIGKLVASSPDPKISLLHKIKDWGYDPLYFLDLSPRLVPRHINPFLQSAVLTGTPL